MKKKIVSLYGFFGIGNVGNEAMLRALIEPIRNRFHDNVEFRVFCRHPDTAYDETYGCKTVKNLEHNTREEARNQWFKGMNPNDTEYFTEFARHIAFSDLVILGPGQYLVETGANGLFRGALAQAGVVSQLCRTFDVPLYGVALACEEIRTPWSAIAIREILENLCSMNFRDPVSVENLKTIGIELNDPPVFGDLALAPEPADTGLAKEVLKGENIPDKKGRRLALAHRNLYFLPRKEEVNRTMAEVLEKWLSHPGRDIITIPQNTYNIGDDRDDDRVAIEHLISSVPGGTDRIYRIREERRPEALEAVYGTCDVTLASRLHGSVFSCKQGTPPVVLNCMNKMQGFYKRLGFEELLFSPGDPADKITQQLENILQNRSRLSAAILSRVTEIRKKAGNYSRIAIELLSKYKPSEKNIRIRNILTH